MPRGPWTPRRSGHFVVCGGDPLAVRLVEELRRLKEDVVVIAPSRSDEPGRDMRAMGATVVESARPDAEAFRRADLASARAVALVDQDDAGNIRAALAAQEQNPDVRLVVRMFNTRLGDRVRTLFEDCAVLSDSAMAAPPFVAAALGELAASHVSVAGRTLVVAARDGEGAATVNGTRELPVVCGLARTTPHGTAVLPDDPDTADLVLAFAEPNHGPIDRHRPSRASLLLRGVRTLVDRRLRVTLGALAGVLLLGTLLFATIGPYSVWGAAYATILTAAGSGDFAPEADGWFQAVQVTMTVAGLTVVPVVTAAVVDAIVSLRLRGVLGAQVGRMADHVVVCGLGNLGSLVAEQLHSLGVAVVGVERDPAAPGVRRAHRLGLPVVSGDASLEETLRAAGVPHARCVVSVTDDDVTNLEAALTTRALGPQVRVVLRLHDDVLAGQVEEKLGIALSRSVSRLAAPAFAVAMLERHLVATIPVNRRVLFLADVPVAATSPLDGAPVARAELAGQARVLARSGRDGDGVYWTPHAGTVVSSGDRLLVLTTRAGLSHVLLARAPVAPPGGDSDG